MRAKEFGDLVGGRMAELGISQNRLASRLGELSDGRIFDSTQIRLLREGRRRLDRELVQRLIDVLHLDPAEAWAAAGILPPGVTADMIRRLELVATDAMTHKPGKLAIPLAPELDDDELLRRLGVPQLADRRRKRDRRRLYLVRPVVAEQVSA